MPAFLMNKSFLGASVGVQNGSKTTMAKATKVVKQAARQVASKVGSAKGFRRYQGAPLCCRCPGLAAGFLGSAPLTLCFPSCSTSE